jgi:Toprim domain
MPRDAFDLARRLARNAEAVCRHYLSNGRRDGRYWRVGDVHNTPGRSLFVRLTGAETGKGAAGKWRDAALGQHGDLLDIIQVTCGYADFHDVAEEARRFLSLPHPQSEHVSASAPGTGQQDTPAPAGSPEAARRLFKASQPLVGTIAESYLRHRAITAFGGTEWLRFHPRCYYRPDEDAASEARPAMIAAVTDLEGVITGVHRTWLDPSGRDKAHVEWPRRSMGHLLGNAVRFGVALDVLAAGEGIETMLSLRSVLPNLPMAAALSAAHLAAILFPVTLRRLYILRDADPAGDSAVERLTERAQAAGIEALVLSSQLGDFNDDLCKLGVDDLLAALRVQLAPEDAARFMGR